MTISPQPKPMPQLLTKRKAKADLATIDREQRVICKARSGGQCEVIVSGVRCDRRAAENHHLIAGIGRRNTGRSLLAAHRLEVCQRCHEEITGHVLQPTDWTTREYAATVTYQRVL
jgi:hypothetical protein